MSDLPKESGLALADIEPTATRRLAPAHANKTVRFMGTPYPDDSDMLQPVGAQYENASEPTMIGRFIWYSRIGFCRTQMVEDACLSSLEFLTVAI